MGALLGPPGSLLILAGQPAGAEPLAILSPQAASIHQRPPLESGNIVGRAVTRLIGAVLLEANDEWQLQHRYMQVEAMAELASPLAEAEPAQIPPQAA
jgi:hypothetical protein